MNKDNKIRLFATHSASLFMLLYKDLDYLGFFGLL